MSNLIKPFIALLLVFCLHHSVAFSQYSSPTSVGFGSSFDSESGRLGGSGCNTPAHLCGSQCCNASQQCAKSKDGKDSCSPPPCGDGGTLCGPVEEGKLPTCCSEKEVCVATPYGSEAFTVSCVKRKRNDSCAARVEVECPSNGGSVVCCSAGSTCYHSEGGFGANKSGCCPPGTHATKKFLSDEVRCVPDSERGDVKCDPGFFVTLNGECEPIPICMQNGATVSCGECKVEGPVVICKPIVIR
jgi:hypothetical protein